MEHKIIGLSGSNGAGKDSIGHILRDHYNYLFISVTDLLREEAKKRGLEPIRQVTSSISAEWRKQYGLAVLVDSSVTKYQDVANKYSGVVISSIRNPGEADGIHNYGGTMIWVDADPKIRYERIQANLKSRGRLDDDKDFKQFIKEEEREMHHTGDETTLNMAGVKQKADIFIDNSEGGLDSLRDKLESVLNLS